MQDTSAALLVMHTQNTKSQLSPTCNTNKQAQSGQTIVLETVCRANVS